MANFTNTKWDRVTIENEGDETTGDDWWVVGHGTYERSSVLHGQYKRALIEHFDTVEEAAAKYPKAEVIEGSTRPYRPEGQSLADLSGLPSCPPRDFDPGFAGEHWDDDY